MKNKIILSAVFTSYLFAGNYDNGIDFYTQGKYQKAIDSFTIASNNNDNRAMLAIGVIYANGDGVDKSDDKSFEWFKKAADAGNKNSWMKLGNIYAVKEDYKNSYKWFLKAAKKGDAKAAYNLGYFYTGGLGVKMDLEESLFWYEKASISGDTNAQLNLGFMYIGGHGTKVDYKKAAYWIKKAKLTGSTKADTMWEQFKLYDYED